MPAIKNKKVLFFSRDPGAANCIIPVYKKFTRKRKVKADLAGKDFALKKYDEFKLEYEDIARLIPSVNLDSVKGFLRKNGYTLVVTGVESTDLTNRLLWQAANELGIKSVAIIDSWINYEIRFTFDEPGKYKENSLKIFPTFICTIDEFAKREMVKRGLPKDKIIITGQPYFETVMERNASIDKKRRAKICKSLSLKECDYIATFVSEPIIESYADPLYFGYTEFSILEQIIKALGEIASENSRQYALVIRLHPRNKKELFNEFLKTVNLPKNVKIIVEENLLSQELISISDIVVGMSSMFLVETAIANKPYVSVQIGLKIEDPFILSRMGVSKTILSYDDLVLLFRSSVHNRVYTKKHKFSFIPDASNKIIKLIEKIL